MPPETLPDGWTERRFDEMAKMVSERVDPAETDLDVYVGLEHIEPETLRIKAHGVPSDVKGQKLRFRPGHVIFGKRRAYQRKLAVAEVDGICSAHAMVLEARPDVVHPDFLPFFMQSDLFMDRAVQISVGGLSPTINWKTLRKQTFALPPMDRQRELVEVFRGVEDVLTRQDDALISAHHLYRALLTDLTSGDPESEDWSVKKLTEVTSYQNGKAFPSKQYQDFGIRLLRPGNLSIHGYVKWNDDNTTHLPDSWADEAPSFLLEPGEIVMNLTAQSLDDEFLGRVCLVPEGPVSLLNQRIARFTPIGIDSGLLFWALKSPYFRRQVDRVPTGTKVQHIYNSDLDSMDLLVPNSPEKQREIASTLFMAQREQKTLRSHIGKAQKLKRSLLSDLLSPEAAVAELEA